MFSNGKVLLFVFQLVGRVSFTNGGKIMDISVSEESEVERKRSQDLFLKVINFLNEDDKNSGTVEGHSCYIGAAPLSP